MWIANYIGATTIIKSNLIYGTTHLLGNVISVSLSGLNNIYNLLTTNSNTIINKYKKDLVDMDIDLKLKLIDNWLIKIDINFIKKDTNMNLMYNKITDSCNNISTLIQLINQKIVYHNTKWFNYWRSLDLEDDINSLKKEIAILNNRLILINLIK